MLVVAVAASIATSTMRPSNEIAIANQAGMAGTGGGTSAVDMAPNLGYKTAGLVTSMTCLKLSA